MPEVVAGVPPDYFSEGGQKWGTVLYRWDVHQSEGWRWWSERMKRMLRLFDIVRIDHFRAVHSNWAIPTEDEDARHGWWQEGPADELLEALVEASGAPGASSLRTSASYRRKWWLCADDSTSTAWPFSSLDLTATRPTRTTQETSPAIRSCTPAPTTTTPRKGGGRALTTRSSNVWPDLLEPEESSGRMIRLACESDGAMAVLPLARSPRLG